jgi:endonuclease IV
MAGKGTEIGSTIEELKIIINGVKFKNKIGVCLDTCHISDSGVDITNFDEYLRSIGYKYSMTTVHPDNIYCARNIMKNGLEKVSQKTFKRGIRNIYFKEL